MPCHRLTATAGIFVRLRLQFDLSYEDREKVKSGLLTLAPDYPINPLKMSWPDRKRLGTCLPVVRHHLTRQRNCQTAILSVVS